MSLQMKETGEPIKDRMKRLRREIAEAQREWENASRFFQYAEGSDQVDYAIYAIISAEKRYEMLLRKAKQLDAHWSAWGGVSQ